MNDSVAQILQRQAHGKNNDGASYGSMRSTLCALRFLFNFRRFGFDVEEPTANASATSRQHFTTAATTLILDFARTARQLPRIIWLKRSCDIPCHIFAIIYCTTINGPTSGVATQWGFHATGCFSSEMNANLPDVCALVLRLFVIWCLDCWSPCVSRGVAPTEC